MDSNQDYPASSQADMRCSCGDPSDTTVWHRHREPCVIKSGQDSRHTVTGATLRNFLDQIHDNNVPVRNRLQRLSASISLLLGGETPTLVQIREVMPEPIPVLALEGTVTDVGRIGSIGGEDVFGAYFLLADGRHVSVSGISLADVRMLIIANKKQIELTIGLKL